MTFRKATEDEFIITLERHALENRSACYEITFAEGDVYLCQWDNGEYVDNDESLESPEYEEWYELDYRVKEVLKPGPNKDPRYEFLQVSVKHQPTLVMCGKEVVYQT